MKDAEYLKLVGKRIKEIRLVKKMSQVELGYECGFDRSNMHRIEAGTNNLTIKTLLTISRALKVDIKDLLP